MITIILFISIAVLAIFVGILGIWVKKSLAANLFLSSKIDILDEYIAELQEDIEIHEALLCGDFVSCPAVPEGLHAVLLDPGDIILPDGYEITCGCQCQ